MFSLDPITDCMKPIAEDIEGIVNILWYSPAYYTFGLYSQFCCNGALNGNKYPLLD